MLIVCPSCATAYNVDVASLQQGGRQVRCVRCRKVWHAEATRADQPMAAAGPPAPPQFAVQDAMKSFTEQLAASRLPQPPTAAVGEVQWSDKPAQLATASGGPSALAAAAGNEAAAHASRAVVEVESPPLAPVDVAAGEPTPEATAASRAADEPHRDIETYAARHKRRGAKRRAMRWPLSHLQNGIAALLIIDAVLFAWRNDVVRVLPQTASFYAMLGLGVNLRGLVFVGVATTTEMHDGVPILVVQGRIVNIAPGIVDVPRIRFAARNAAGDEIYSWTAVPPRTILRPREAVAFRTRFASPPPDVRDMLVRFVTRRDMLSAAH